MFFKNLREVSSGLTGQIALEMKAHRARDRDMMQATSLCYEAEKLGSYVLLARGEEDRGVGHHSKHEPARCRHKSNANVEWVSYQREGDSRSGLSNYDDLSAQVEQFLGRHIRPSSLAR